MLFTDHPSKRKNNDDDGGPKNGIPRQNMKIRFSFHRQLVILDDLSLIIDDDGLQRKRDNNKCIFSTDSSAKERDT